MSELGFEGWNYDDGTVVVHNVSLAWVERSSTPGWYGLHFLQFTGGRMSSGGSGWSIPEHVLSLPTTAQHILQAELWTLQRRSEFLQGRIDRTNEKIAAIGVVLKDVL